MQKAILEALAWFLEEELEREIFRLESLALNQDAKGEPEEKLSRLRRLLKNLREVDWGEPRFWLPIWDEKWLKENYDKEYPRMKAEMERLEDKRKDGQGL